MNASASSQGGNQRFLFVGQDPCLDLVNTRPLRDGEPRDLLATPADLGAWMVAAQLLAPGREREVDEAAWRRALLLRERLRESLEEIVAGGGPRPGLVELVNAGLADDIGHQVLEAADGGFGIRFESRGEGAAALVGILARAAAELLSREDLAHVKRCQHPSCVLYFLDTTRNRSRRWCSMETCGNQMKAAAFRRRRRRRRS